ncbi:MAG: helix-turn-helix transcriptional regulator [Lachnospiraceae bacterium]|jgi:Predicted transcriptional regulators|nr:helix-turn-helix transcriptional regulator [Lachnospiraceae bacterium]
MNDAKELTAGMRIKKLRLEKRYTREQLAYLADISDKFLYEIESGKKGFSAVTLMKLSKALNVSMDYIMAGKDMKSSEDGIVATLEQFKPNTLENVERLIKIAYELTKINE